MTPIEEFEKTYGSPKRWLQRAGLHSQEQVPTDDEQRLYFALLEAVDWQCWFYKDALETPTEDEAKAFLKKYKDRIKCPPPSYIGLLTGAYKFIT
jgi:hypothetical protein